VAAFCLLSSSSNAFSFSFTNPAQNATALMSGMDSAMTEMLDAFRTSQKLNIEARAELS